MYDKRENLDEYLAEFIEALDIDINAAKEGGESEMMNDSQETETMFGSWREADNIKELESE